jgi:hypothetical protein
MRNLIKRGKYYCVVARDKNRGESVSLRSVCMKW